MSVRTNRRARLHLALLATLLGVNAAVWFVNLRPNAEVAPHPAFPAFELDREAVPTDALADPFVGNAAVRGVVRSASGAALGGVAVHAWAGNTAAQTTTGADGSYALRDLPAGPLRLVLGVEGFRGALRDDLFLDAEDELALDFALEPRVVASPELVPAPSAGAPLALSGRCLDGHSGGTWYRVHLEPARATDPLFRGAVETAENGTGFFRFEQVPPGRYRLRVTAAGGPSRDALEFARLEELVVPCGELSVSFLAPRHRLRLHDAAELGKALPRARVAAFWRPSDRPANAEDEWLVAHQRADAEGLIALLPMPPGRLRLVANAPGYESAERELLVEDGGTRELELALVRR
ncbi:MAG: carboxypeptidase regulatory-like domain-containing protein [Planctomycetes bacterium]|nr:carboxypeptidase regulatory-like domain-containing protein [Planctomycetota bacterium]